MKYTITKKSILSKVALISVMFVMGSYGSYAHADSSETNVEKINVLKKTFNEVENYLEGFVSVKSKTPFNEFVLRIVAKLQNLQRHIEELTRKHTCDISKEIDDLMEYALQQFSIMSNVFKKYNGKPESQALNFASEIKRDFDTDKIFSTLIRKLKQLKAKAEDKALIEAITAFINDIEIKNKAWNAKGQMALLTGIQHRMKC